MLEEDKEMSQADLIEKRPEEEGAQDHLSTALVRGI
jgi:hypothetical protein